MRFEALCEVLLKGGVAPRHVRRYIAELSEHLDDLTAQQREAGFDAGDAAIRARARLGSDAELAEAMLHQKQFRSITARAPWAVFGLMPPLASIAAAFALVVPLALTASALGMVSPGGINTPSWFQGLAFAITNLGNLAVAPLLAAGFVVVAMRQRILPAWPLLAIFLIALLDLRFRADFPVPGHHGGTLSIDAALWAGHFDSLVRQWPLTLTQLLLTLSPAILLYRKHRAPV
jgi:hypothetical protein